MFINVLYSQLNYKGKLRLRVAFVFLHGYQNGYSALKTHDVYQCLQYEWNKRFQGADNFCPLPTTSNLSHNKGHCSIINWNCCVSRKSLILMVSHSNVYNCNYDCLDWYKKFTIWKWPSVYVSMPKCDTSISVLL